MQNFSGFIISVYTPEMQEFSLSDTAAAMKNIIQISNTKDNALRLINQRYTAGQEYEKMPISQIFGDKTSVRQEKRAVRQSLGYLLTNVGKLSIPQCMESLIEDMETYIPGITSPIVFSMNSVGDKMTLSVSQSFDDDTLIRSFSKICSDNGLTMNWKDMGIEELDTLEIDGVEMLLSNMTSETGYGYGKSERS